MDHGKALQDTRGKIAEEKFSQAVNNAMIKKLSIDGSSLFIADHIADLEDANKAIDKRLESLSMEEAALVDKLTTFRATGGDGEQGRRYTTKTTEEMRESMEEARAKR